MCVDYLDAVFLYILPSFMMTTRLSQGSALSFVWHPPTDYRGFDASIGFCVFPYVIAPSAQEWNDIRPVVIPSSGMPWAGPGGPGVGGWVDRPKRSPARPELAVSYSAGACGYSVDILFLFAAEHFDNAGSRASAPRGRVRERRRNSPKKRAAEQVLR
jgi:hypothetical protein